MLLSSTDRKSELFHAGGSNQRRDGSAVQTISRYGDRRNMQALRLLSQLSSKLSACYNLLLAFRRRFSDQGLIWLRFSPRHQEFVISLNTARLIANDPVRAS